MGQHYLDEIRKLGYGTADEFSADDERQEVWRSEREKYGFDGRDTWNLDHKMTEMLYERLNMYLVKAQEIVDLSYHKFDFEGKTYTQIELIEMMIKDARFYLAFEYGALDEHKDGFDDSMTDEDIDNYMSEFGILEMESIVAKKRLWDAWAVVHHNMWW